MRVQNKKSEKRLIEVENLEDIVENLEDVTEKDKFESSLNLERRMTQHVQTRWYRAPEVILVQKTYDEKIDIWSIGCIICELCFLLDPKGKSSGTVLFPGKSCEPLSPKY